MITLFDARIQSHAGLPAATAAGVPLSGSAGSKGSIGGWRAEIHSDRLFAMLDPVAAAVGITPQRIIEGRTRDGDIGDGGTEHPRAQAEGPENIDTTKHVWNLAGLLIPPYMPERISLSQGSGAFWNIVSPVTGPPYSGTPISIRAIGGTWRLGASGEVADGVYDYVWQIARALVLGKHVLIIEKRLPSTNPAVGTLETWVRIQGEPGLTKMPVRGNPADKVWRGATNNAIDGNVGNSRIAVYRHRYLADAGENRISKMGYVQQAVAQSEGESDAEMLALLTANRYPWAQIDGGTVTPPPPDEPPPAPSGSTPDVRALAAADRTTGSVIGTFVVNKPANAQVGDVILAFIESGTASRGISGTAFTGAFTLVVDPGAGASERFWVYARRLVAGDPASWSGSFGGTTETPHMIQTLAISGAPAPAGATGLALFGIEAVATALKAVTGTTVTLDVVALGAGRRVLHAIASDGGGTVATAFSGTRGAELMDAQRGLDVAMAISSEARATSGGGAQTWTMPERSASAVAIVLAGEPAPAADVLPGLDNLTGPLQQTAKTDALFVWTRTNPGTTRSRLVDDGVTGAWETLATTAVSKDHSALGVGAYTFRVEGLSADGLRVLDALEQSWTVLSQRLAPAPPIVLRTTATTVTIGWATPEPANEFVGTDLWQAYKADGMIVADLPNGTREYTFTGLTEGVPVAFRISFGPTGPDWRTRSAWSTAITATPTAQPDTTPPVTTVTGGPPDGSTTQDITPEFAFQANEPGCTFEVRVDAGDPLPIGAAANYTAPAFPGGPHIVAFRATDPAGNVEANWVTVAFVVEEPVIAPPPPAPPVAGTAVLPDEEPEPMHLAFPLRLEPDGSLRQVAQDSLEDVRSCVHVNLHTPVGARPLAPDIGIDDITFSVGVDAESLTAELEGMEPRARVSITASPIDERGHQQLQVDVGLVGDDNDDQEVAE